LQAGVGGLAGGVGIAAVLNSDDRAALGIDAGSRILCFLYEIAE
jgi:hypothetical protein